MTFKRNTQVGFTLVVSLLGTAVACSSASTDGAASDPSASPTNNGAVAASPAQTPASTPATTPVANGAAGDGASDQTIVIAATNSTEIGTNGQVGVNGARSMVDLGEWPGLMFKQPLYDSYKELDDGSTAHSLGLYVGRSAGGTLTFILDHWSGTSTTVALGSTSNSGVRIEEQNAGWWTESGTAVVNITDAGNVNVALTDLVFRRDDVPDSSETFEVAAGSISGEVVRVCSYQRDETGPVIPDEGFPATTQIATDDPSFESDFCSQFR